MPKQKLNSLESLGNFVFSTDPDFEYENDAVTKTPPPEAQHLDEALKQLSKMLKTRCGVGGAVKDGNIIIQGNHRHKVMEILTNEGYNVKRVGG